MRMGLEPTTSGVTGPHSNQLNYRTRSFAVFGVSLKRVAKLGVFSEHARVFLKNFHKNAYKTISASRKKSRTDALCSAFFSI